MKNKKKNLIILFMFLEVMLMNGGRTYDLFAKENSDKNEEKLQSKLNSKKNKIEIESTDSKFSYIEINLHDTEYDLEKMFYKKYGNLYLRYFKINDYFVRYGVTYYPIIQAEYFYKKNGLDVYLGKIDLNGIYDKFGKLICSCPLGIDDGVRGYSSDLLTDPFYLGICIFRDNEMALLNPYAILEIDFENDSLSARYMSDVDY